MRRLAAVAVFAALLSPVSTLSVARADSVGCSVSGSFSIDNNEVTFNNSCHGVATIPSSVTIIGPGAFSGSADLTEVSFPSDSQLVTISDSAFFNTSKLTTINIPKHVTEIAANAFHTATALTTVTFDPEIQLTTFGSDAFKGTTALTSITLPSSLVSLPSYAFMNSGLATVNFPFDSELVSIGDSAFTGNTSLTTFTLPHLVSNIGAGAFSNSSNLATLNFRREAPTVGTDAFKNIADGAVANVSYYSTTFVADGTSHWNGLTINKDTDPKLKCSVSGGALYSGSRLFTGNTFYDINAPCVGDIDIPPFITEIGVSAFGAVTGLTGIRFWPNSLLTTVGRGAFEGATGLVTAELPPSVTTLGTDIFKSDTALKKFQFGAGSVLTSIPTSMFGRTSLRHISIPDSVTSIGDFAFWHDYDLESVTFGSGSKLTSIGQLAFTDNTSLTSIALPKSLISIGNAVFDGASSLTTVTLPSDSALTTLGTGVFQDASSLTSFTFPIGITTIPFGFFQGASGLSSVTFKGFVTSFGAQAFLYTSSLTSIRFAGDAPTLNDSVFKSPPVGAKAYVPRGATGFDADGWSGLQILEYSNCGTSGFVNYDDDEIASNDGCTGALTVSNGTKSIGESAFENATGLTSITLPISLTTIGDFAFAGATNLTTIVIPSAVTSVGENAFKNASSLSSITFNGNEPELGISPFIGVAALARVNVGRNAEGFDMDAFGKWSGLIVYRPLKLITKPSLSGRTVSTRTGTNKLTAARGTWLGGPRLTFTYQWYSCRSAVRNPTQTIPATCTRISGEKSTKLAVKSALKGKYIAVSVSAKIDGATAVTWMTKTSAKVS